jgi:2-amino-4-hydroxy-6-hydroxymethyldihydropteridine diphosphokinase
MPRYVVGIGSNINPRANIVRVLEALSGMTNYLAVSRIIETTPKGFQSDNQFLNMAVCIESSSGQTVLKEAFVQLEIDMGRNRADPDSSKKDRPADLDILFSLPSINLPPEPYLRPLTIELLNDLGFQTDEQPDYKDFKAVRLDFAGRSIGHKTIVLKGQ